MQAESQVQDPFGIGKVPTLYMQYGERLEGTTHLPVPGLRTLVNPQLGTKGCYQACVRSICTMKNTRCYIHASDMEKNLDFAQIIEMHRNMNFDAGFAYASLSAGNQFKFQIIVPPVNWSDHYLLWYLGHIYVVVVQVDARIAEAQACFLPNDIKGHCGGLNFREVEKHVSTCVGTWFADHIDLPVYSEVMIKWTVKNQTELRLPVEVNEQAVDFENNVHSINFYELILPTAIGLSRYIATTYDEAEAIYELVLDGRFEEASWQCVHPDVETSTGDSIYVWEYLNLPCLAEVPISFKKKIDEEELVLAGKCLDMVRHRYFVPPGFQLEDAENKFRIYRHDYLANFTVRAIHARYESYCAQVKSDKFIFKTKNKQARRKQVKKQTPSHVLTADGVFKPLHIDHLIVLTASKINVPLLMNSLANVVQPGAVHSIKLPNLGKNKDELLTLVDNFEHRHGLIDPYYIVVTHRAFDQQYQYLYEAKKKKIYRNNVLFREVSPMLKLTVQGLSSKRINDVAFHSIHLLYEHLLTYYDLSYLEEKKVLTKPKRLVSYNWLVYEESDKVVVTQTVNDETGSVKSEWDTESCVRFTLQDGEATKKMKRHARVEKRQFSGHYDDLFYK